jgi:hypothetical protein
MQGPQATSQRVYVCVKEFNDEAGRREVLAAFSTSARADRFANEFPAYSMDDPASFYVRVVSLELDRNRWNI